LSLEQEIPCISKLFQFISNLFHQIHDFGHRCLQKINRGSLTNVFVTVLDAGERVLGHPVSIPAESPRRTGPRPLTTCGTFKKFSSPKNDHFVG
jgi:hypothetical protein